MVENRLFVGLVRAVSASYWWWADLRCPTLPQKHNHFLHPWACRSLAFGRSREMIVVSWNQVGGASERALAQGHRPSSLVPGRRCSYCIAEGRLSPVEDENWDAAGRDKKVDGLWLSHANVCPFSRIASQNDIINRPLSCNLVVAISLLAILRT